MTEKVKITQEVADAIETLRDLYSNYGIVIAVEKGGSDNLSESRSILFNWTHEEDGENANKLLQALVNGYEIEPKYKVGDWVANLDGSNFYPIGDVKVVEVLKVKKNGDPINGGVLYAQHGESGRWGSPFGNLRHATPEEIKAEKERRLWRSMGREVNEWKHGDCVVIDGDYGQINTNMGCDDEYFNNVSPKRATERMNYGDVQGVFPIDSFISFEEVEPNAETHN